MRALHAPVDNLVSNWAYMVMTSLAWNLKAWWALHLPEDDAVVISSEDRKNSVCCEWNSRRS